MRCGWQSACVVSPPKALASETTSRRQSAIAVARQRQGCSLPSVKRVLVVAFHGANLTNGGRTMGTLPPGLSSMMGGFAGRLRQPEATVTCCCVTVCARRLTSGYIHLACPPWYNAPTNPLTRSGPQPIRGTTGFAHTRARAKICDFAVFWPVFRRNLFADNDLRKCHEHQMSNPP